MPRLAKASSTALTVGRRKTLVSRFCSTSNRRIVPALASFLAGIAGVVGGAFLTLYPGAEWEILVYALVVVIFGGLGSLEGAIGSARYSGCSCRAGWPGNAAPRSLAIYRGLCRSTFVKLRVPRRRRVR
jgi:branched-subunit amino acid ABC-type transport system permease component